MNKEISDRIYSNNDIEKAFYMGIETGLSVLERTIGLPRDDQHLILHRIKNMIQENRAAAVMGKP